MTLALSLRLDLLEKFNRIAGGRRLRPASE